jgi:anti-sigma regulatory factor (Ser/Thr protein kinase)
VDTVLATVPDIELVRRPMLHLPRSAELHEPRTARPALRLQGAGSGADPASAGRTASLAADPGVYLPRRARHLALAACRAWGLPHLADRAALVADELVTNAVVHADTFIELHLRQEAGELVVAVHDGDPRLDPSWWDGEPGGDPEPLANTGYGLCLVRRMVSRYGGYRHREGGKVMWAVLGSQDEAATGGQHVEGGGLRIPDHTPPPPVVRRAVLVNGVRRRVHHGRARWRLELLLEWHAEEPEWVELSLRPTPLHPALPHGHWRVRLEVLVAGLEAAAGGRGVRLYPDPAGQNVLLELPADPPHVVHAPLRQLHAFVGDVADMQGRTVATAATREPSTTR